VTLTNQSTRLPPVYVNYPVLLSIMKYDLFSFSDNCYSEFIRHQMGCQSSDIFYWSQTDSTADNLYRWISSFRTRYVHKSDVLLFRIMD
jgi:hypothetical protein